MRLRWEAALGLTLSLIMFKEEMTKRATHYARLNDVVDLRNNYECILNPNIREGQGRI